MEYLAVGSLMMDHGDAHESMVRVSEHITLEEVNALARSLLAFAADYGREEEVLAEAAGAAPGMYGEPGPTRWVIGLRIWSVWGFGGFMN